MRLHFVSRAARRFCIASALLLALSAALTAEESWEGNAAVIRKGELDAQGLFAASDSFPKNTLIQVENPQNGKTVQVTVVERINGRGSMFLLLSGEAAQALGLSSSEVIRVKAKVLVSMGTPGARGAGSEDMAESPDPDVNPSAALASLPPLTEEAVVEEAGPAEAPPAEEPLAEAPAAEEPPPPETAAAETEPTIATAEGVEVAEAQPAEAAETPVVEAPPQAPPAEETEPAEAPSSGGRLEELASRIPQKQLFLPSRQSEAFALAVAPEQPPEEPPPIEEQIAAPAEEELPEIAAAEEEPAPAEEPAPLAEAEELPPEQEAPLLSLGEAQAGEEPGEEARLEALEPEVEPEEPAVAEIAPAVEEEAVELASSLPEAEAAPPTEEAAPLTTAEAPEALEEEPSEISAAAPEIVEPEAAPPEAEIEIAAAPMAPEKEEPQPPVQASGALSPQSYYLQLGAYSTRSLAEKLVRELTASARYTVAIFPAASGSRTLYKVLIGPLNRDESGTLLFQFRARGFKDAFVHYTR